jgi:hypothetical protein
VDWSAAKRALNVYLPSGPVVVQYNITCNGHFSFIDDLILDGMIILLKEKL